MTDKREPDQTQAQEASAEPMTTDLLERMGLAMDMSLVVPPDAERRPGVMRRVSLVHHLSPQHLPPAVTAMAIPFEAIPVTPEQAAALFEAWGAHHDGMEERRDALVDGTGLMPLVEAAIARTGGRAFVKLGTRSAKDGYDADDDRRPNPVGSTAAAFTHLLDSWDRVPSDLQDARIAGIATAIVVRPFLRFPVDREYRVYVTDGRLAGISQMFYDREHGDPARARAEDEPRVRALAARLIPAMAAHRKTVVDHGTHATVEDTGTPCLDFAADVIVLADGRDLLIEVNPGSRHGLSDPTLFRDRMGNTAGFPDEFRIKESH